MRTIKLTIAATETHCHHNGTLCGFLKYTWPRPRCLAFADGEEEPKSDMEGAGYLRLPECIAAEKKPRASDVPRGTTALLYYIKEDALCVLDEVAGTMTCE